MDLSTIGWNQEARDKILLDDGAHAIGDDPGTSRGSAGKRVWNVLRF